MSNNINSKNFAEVSGFTKKIEFKNLEKLIQTIPSEIMNILKNAAQQAGRSMNEEVTIRLFTTIVNPSAFGFSVLYDTVMGGKFTEAQVKAEKEAREKGWMYVYQKEKLRLYVELENKLPKKFKENFLLENFDEELKKMRAEIEAERKQEGDKE